MGSFTRGCAQSQIASPGSVLLTSLEFAPGQFGEKVVKLPKVFVGSASIFMPAKQRLVSRPGRRRSNVKDEVFVFLMR